jgi:AAA-ATPase Vps4-associated protein 1
MAATAAPANTLASTRPPTLVNVYYERKVADPGKPCFICHKLTTFCLGIPHSLSPMPQNLFQTDVDSCRGSLFKKKINEYAATIDVSDFLYTCSSHLSDSGFARPIEDSDSSSPGSDSPAQQPTVTQEDIDRITKEYYDKKGKAKKGDKDKDESGKASSQNSPLSPATTTPSSPAAAAASPLAPSPKHKKYALHRRILQMRQDIKTKAFYSQSAKQATSKLPSAPRGLPGTLPPPPPSELR